MDLNYSPEELAFRDEVRSWLAKNLPRELKQKVENYAHLSKEDLLRWHRILADKGWMPPRGQASAILMCGSIGDVLAYCFEAVGPEAVAALVAAL